jgi:hypothetical protein
MKTSDFYIKPSSKNINESMKKKFGEKLDLDSYTNEQLNKTFQLIENKMAGYKNSKFNDTLNSEEYHRLTFMRDAVKTAISERVMTKAAKGVMKYGKDGMKALAKAGKDGKSLDPVRKKYDKYDESKGSKPDFLDLDKDGNKKEPMKKAAKDAKKKPVKENMQTMFELAKDLAEKYKDAHMKGNHRKMAFYEKALEECGATISHGPMGECMMSHPHQAGGKPMPVGLLSPSGIVSPKGPAPLMTSERRVAEAKKSKPDFLDLDKDGNKKESMKKAAKDKGGDEGKKEGKKGMSAKQQKFFGKKKPVKESVDMAISRYLREGEEGKAELVMAVKNMVDKFTGWSEDIAKMQAQSAMEMADEIRDELGNDQAEAFTQAIAPALDAAFQAVKAAREALNGQVGSMTGGGPAAMGAEPDMGAEMPDIGGDDMGGDMGADMGGDDMGTDIAAAGETPPGGREKRESIERTRRLTRILSGR